MVILEVEDEVTLINLTKSLGVPVCRFFEPDFPKGVNSACTGPVDVIHRQRFQRFRLWKAPRECVS